MRRRRLCYDLSTENWQHFLVAGEVFVVGYLFHFLPYFFMERTLFLHHYLTAFVFKVLLLAAIIEHIYRLLLNKVVNRWIIFSFIALVFLWLLFVIQTFFKFCVLNYGIIDLNENDLVNLRWRDTWDFILHKK